MSYVIFDLETSIHAALKRKANPFYKLNTITAIGHKRQGDSKNTGRYYGAVGAEDGWMVPMLEGTSFLVGHNIKFDILHGICQGPLNRKAWIDYIDRGGKIWCTQLAEYLLHGQAQEFQIASLDDTAPRYGGNLKNDAVKALWEEGVNTPDIDKDMLMEYLVGWESWHETPHPAGVDDFGDIGNTELIFRGQVQAFRARKAMKSVDLNMGAMVFTIEAEFNGMFVDLPWAMEHAKVLENQLVEATKELQEFIPKDLPFDFSWGSWRHKSALIFGGKIKYEARTAITTDGKPLRPDGSNQAYSQMDQERILLEGYDPKGDAEAQEKHITAAELYRWQAEDPDTAPIPLRYTGGKNKGEVKTKKFKVPDPSKPKSKMMPYLYTFPGYTQPDDRWKASEPGFWSTAADIIEELSLRKGIPFLEALSRRADLHKDLSTYFIITDDEGKQKGMLTLVGPDGIIHHQLHMVRTITGRLSSSDPNLQNVSKGKYDAETGKMSGSQIKRAFISRFVEEGQRGVIVQSDFTSLEIYVQAALTMCRQLIEDLRAGLDMHVLRAEQAWGAAEGKDYAYILKAAKDDTHPEHAKWNKLRSDAKVFSFQRAYGAGVKKIALTTGMSEEDVEKLVAAEAERYPELITYIEDVTAEIQRNRVPTSRVCEHPEIKGLICQLGRSHFTTPDGKLYSYSESPSPKFVAEKPRSRGGTPASFSPTEIKNYVVQGTGGEWAKAAMYLAVRAFYRHGNFGGLALLVNQVHDAVYVDAAASVQLEASALLHACMLEASTYMEWHFSWKLPLGVPTETKVGANMMEEKNPGEGFAELVEEYRAVVRREFIGNHTPSFN
ncbi:DNA polymerase A [Stenotrophomonas phage BUCT603B1]|nr:DNA polymerase A [Stenotrophomonas phage BUCT603B1]